MKWLNYFMAPTVAETAVVLREMFCNDLTNLILEFLKPLPKPYNPRSTWRHVDEYDSTGMYGHVPMCPVGLPLF